MLGAGGAPLSQHTGKLSPHSPRGITTPRGFTCHSSRSLTTWYILVRLDRGLYVTHHGVNSEIPTCEFINLQSQVHPCQPGNQSFVSQVTCVRLASHTYQAWSEHSTQKEGFAPGPLCALPPLPKIQASSSQLPLLGLQSYFLNRLSTKGTGS